MMLNGELYRGGHDGAGEFGHSTVVEGGPLCNCGKRGCVEAYAGEPALRRAAGNAIGAPITLQPPCPRPLRRRAAPRGIPVLPATRSGLRFPRS